MDILWHAIHMGKLCRIRKGRTGSLISERWSNGSWQPGPDFSDVDFKGKMISQDEADEWMMAHFREKNFLKSARKRKG
ncbi:hypothetical protein ACFL2O_02250 [Thermodesulfobacteriota bacterium]